MKKTIKKDWPLLLGIMAVLLAFAGCDRTDSYIADQLRNRDWQGYIGAYYSDRWGLSGEEYATVMRFTSRDSWYTSGRGEELDYSRLSRYDYAYCTFKWFIVDGEITLIYDDAKWNPIYIVDYSLNGSRFRGNIYDGSSRRIQFDLQNEGFSDWGYYNRSTGSYGGFSNQNYYFSREQRHPLDSVSAAGAAEAQPLPLVIDRTEEVRRESGEADAVSIVSGIFAEKWQSQGL